MHEGDGKRVAARIGADHLDVPGRDDEERDVQVLTGWRAVSAFREVSCAEVFGDVDAYVLCEAPDHATMSAASLAINAAGSVHLKTVVLLTPEEMDQAARKSVTYRAPGQ